MKIGRLEVNFAEKSKPPINQEVGTAVPEGLGSMIDKEAIDTSKLKIKDFVKMRKNDGTAMALYNIITLPILSLAWDIKPHPDDKNGEQAKFIEDALRRPPHMGGMSTPFSLVLADMLRAVVEGYRLFEKVYDINEDGKIVYRKIATRDNQTLTLLMDDRGGFDGAKQMAYIGKKFETVIIPRDRCFLFTYGKDKNWLFGESAFIAAYQHYDEKRKLYYLGRLAAQALSIPPKIAKAAPKAKQDQIDSVSQALNDLVGVNSATVLPDGFDMAKLDLSSGRFDVMALINHHNAAMAMSVLAHFMMLGTGSSTGSWALSQDQTDMFILALKGLKKNLEEHITSYLLPDLINYNFEKPLYPTFEFNEMTDSTIGMLKEVFLKIVDKLPQGVPDYLIEGIADKLGDQLDINKPDGQKGTSKEIAKTANAGGNPGLHDDKGDRRFLAENRWSRALTPAEKKVNFAGLQNKYNTLEQELMQSIAPVWEAMRDDTVARLQKLLDAKDYKAINEFKIKSADEYKRLLIDGMMDAYNYAKTGAADEMGLKSPASPNIMRNLINQEAQMYVDKQFNDLQFNIQSAVNDAIRKNQLAEGTDLSVADLIAAVAGMITGYLSENVAAGVAAAVATAINIGRDTVFEIYKGKIAKYQCSAILDSRTCPICRDLDGSVVDYATYHSTQWHFPIHFHDRCIWVAIMKTETDQPEVTGLPDKPGGVTAPLLQSPVFNFSMQHNH